MALEGGFQGRTNKLVDGCYSFWIGSVFALIEAELARQRWRAGKEGKAVVGECEYREQIIWGDSSYDEFARLQRKLMAFTFLLFHGIS